MSMELSMGLLTLRKTKASSRKRYNIGSEEVGGEFRGENLKSYDRVRIYGEAKNHFQFPQTQEL